jgi:hypothetical protein
VLTSLMSNGNYMYHMYFTVSKCTFLLWFLCDSHGNIFLMVKCGVLFEVRTGFSHVI